MNTEAGTNPYEQIPGQRWWMLLILGLLLVTIGVAAIAMPLVSSLTLTFILGFALLIGGVFQAVGSFKLRGTDSFWVTLVTGILAGIVGLLILSNPVEGTLALTLLLAVYFFVGGVFKVVAGVQASGLPNSGWIVAGGILSIILGVLVGIGWPSTATWFLGLMVGIDLIFAGLVSLQTSLLLHSVHKALTRRPAAGAAGA